MRRLAAVALALSLGTVVPAAEALSVTVEPGGAFLTVFEDFPLPLPAEWLRERCLSEAFADPDTKQPRFTPDAYAPPLVATASLGPPSSASPQFLSVTFRDGHESKFELARLLERAKTEAAGAASFAGSGALMQPSKALSVPARPWTAATLGPMATVQWADLTATKNSPRWLTARLAVYRALLETGIALVKGAPAAENQCKAIAASLTSLRVTEWGEQFKVRTVPDDSAAAEGGAGGALKDLAYTANALGFHTDNPYRHPVPSLQILHAIKHCTCGAQPAACSFPGETTTYNGTAYPPCSFPCAACSVVNSFVDGWALADRLSDAEFDVLASVAVRFETNGGDGGSALWHAAPILEVAPAHRRAHGADSDSSVEPCRGSACLLAVRFSAKSGGYAPLHLGAERLQAFYAARRRFSQLAHGEAHGMQLRMQLEAGDMVVFDNTRLLHARSSVAPTDGERFLQGCYADGDGVQLYHEKLHRVQQAARAAEAAAADTAANAGGDACAAANGS